MTGFLKSLHFSTNLLNKHCLPFSITALSLQPSHESSYQFTATEVELFGWPTWAQGQIRTIDLIKSHEWGREFDALVQRAAVIVNHRHQWMLFHEKDTWLRQWLLLQFICKCKGTTNCQWEADSGWLHALPNAGFLQRQVVSRVDRYR